ncbi:MAG TPA: F0F1 ATP synthase subunit delta [Actinomycetales bacterium]|jgi:F-type H+-transporting ATPase subunit delta
MQGTSRGSLLAAQERLETLLGAPGTDRAAVGDALFAVTGLLDSSGALRRAVTDPSRDGEAKAALVVRLLDGKVDGAVVDLVAGLARARWAQSRDITDALELLAVTSVIADAQDKGELDRVEDELFRFRRTVAGDPALRSALTDRSATGERKAALVSQLLDGKVSATTLRLARQAVLAARGLRFDAVMTTYGELAAKRRQQLVAHVVVALPLDEDQRARLTEALARQYGTAVHLNVDVDPDVLGGIRVEIGDEVLDGTIQRRLDEARRRLTR